jgi:NADPH-dependent 2,4-dienoyl-CoA reductase/sulfur reductase-like enzyme
MKKFDTVVIGGGPAGITAAISARRNYPQKSVALIRREEQVLIPCGIPYIFGTLKTPEQNLIPDAGLKNNAIELIVAGVDKIDAKNKTVHIQGGEISWDKLVIATGSRPFVPPIPGKDLSGIFDIKKDINYLREVKKYISEAKNIVIVGGGFIGVEFADEIVKTAGKSVSIIEMMPNCLALSYDVEFCAEAENKLRANGVKIYTSTRVESFGGDKKVEFVKISSGESIPADLVILGIGAHADVEMARGAGISIGTTGGIIVDRRMETSVKNIFACGDCTEKNSFFGGRLSQLKLASIATQEARIAGANLFETRLQGAGTLGVWSTVISSMAFATAGLTESAAVSMGYRIITTSVEGINRHPGVMPGGFNTRLKLVFDASSSVLLGAQACGGESVGEMVNVTAALIQKNMRADEITLFQMGTHPALSASPIAYHLVNAAEMACQKFLSKG